MIRLDFGMKFLWLEIQYNCIKLENLDFGPLSLENEALLKSNFPHSCFLHFKNVFEKIVGMADRKK